MWNATSLGRRDLCRSDLNLTIDLDGVAVDNLATDVQRKRDGQLALARRSWADDRDYFFLYLIQGTQARE